MRAALKRLQGDLDLTTIYVTPVQIEAMTLAHRVAVRNEGVVQQSATLREICDQSANLLVAGFIGSPPMNTHAGAIEGGAFWCRRDASRSETVLRGRMLFPGSAPGTRHSSR